MSEDVCELPAVAKWLAGQGLRSWGGRVFRVPRWQMVVGLVFVPAANLCFKALEINLESACLSWGGRSFDYGY